MRVLTIVVALLAGGPLVGAGQTPVSPAEGLAARVQAHYAGVRDFTADFVLSTTSPLTPKPLVERGTLRVKKPGRMRWVFRTDDKREFVADGVHIYSFFPKDKYVMRSPMPTDSEASTALLFLSGRGHLVRDFTSTLASGAQAGESRLELRPRTRQTDFERLTLDVANDTLAFRGLVVHDLQGGESTYRFSNLRENVGLTDAEFVFTIPRGVVIR